MPQENSRRQGNDVAAMVGLLRTAEAGQLDSIECPQCQSLSVSVRFTHPRPDEYRTWFICTSCSFRMRSQNSKRPQHYSAAREDASLDALDTAILKRKRFAPP